MSYQPRKVKAVMKVAELRLRNADLTSFKAANSRLITLTKQLRWRVNCTNRLLSRIDKPVDIGDLQSGTNTTKDSGLSESLRSFLK